jgi:hypothetical protein
MTDIAGCYPGLLTQTQGMFETLTNTDHLQHAHTLPTYCVLPALSAGDTQQHICSWAHNINICLSGLNAGHR